MSRPITQPVNQVRLTNVAVVRMNRCGRRFEVACYRNKIVNYRQGIETDLSEVLQTDRVFSNVSKGRFASASDLRDAFGTSDEEEACRIILERGQVQVSDRERSARLESTLREVAATVSAKCVDPNSNRPYTPSQIRDAMREVGFMVHPTRSVKQQFLDCVRLLREKGALDIERAKMELRVVVPAERGEEAARRLREVGATDLVIASEDGGGEGGGGGPSSSHRRIVFLVDPSLYRAVDAVASKECGGRLEILRQCVAEEGDAELESEVQRKSQRRRGDWWDRRPQVSRLQPPADSTTLNLAVCSREISGRIPRRNIQNCLNGSAVIDSNWVETFKNCRGPSLRRCDENGGPRGAGARGTCKVCHKPTNDYCYGCNQYFCHGTKVCPLFKDDPSKQILVQTIQQGNLCQTTHTPHTCMLYTHKQAMEGGENDINFDTMPLPQHQGNEAGAAVVSPSLTGGHTETDSSESPQAPDAREPALDKEEVREGGTEAASAQVREFTQVGAIRAPGHVDEMVSPPRRKRRLIPWEEELLEGRQASFHIQSFMGDE